MFYQLYCLKVICDEKEMNWLRYGTLSLTYLVVSINKHSVKNIFVAKYTYQEYCCVPAGGRQTATFTLWEENSVFEYSNMLNSLKYN